MNILVMQSLKPRGHIDQQITRDKCSYTRGTQVNVEHLRGLGIPSGGSEHDGKVCYNFNDSDNGQAICSIKYDDRIIKP